MKNPQSLMDLVNNMKSYIDEMREAGPGGYKVIKDSLRDYASKTVKSLEPNKVENQILVVQLTDAFYRNFWNLGSVDIYTNGYIALVLYEIFFRLGQKGAHIFYVLDNAMRDDYLYLILEQFPPAGFDIITPHITTNLKYETVNTTTDNLSYEEVEEKFKASLKRERNIIYIERDSSVNYLNRAVQFAKTLDDDYAKIYRNAAYDNPFIQDINDIGEIV